MRKMSGLFLAVLVTAAILAGCGGGGDDSSAPTTAEGGGSDTTTTTADGGGGGGGSGGELVEACDLVTLEELTDTLGQAVILDPDPGNEFTCNYQSAGPPAIIFSINIGEAGGTADEIFEGVQSADDNAETIDIGEAGYVAFSGAQVGFLQDGISYQVNLGGNLDEIETRDLSVAVALLIEANL